MIKPSTFLFAGALSLFAAVACTQPAAAPFDVRATMQNRVNPAMLAIWDVGNNALNDDGGIDPALMDDAKWAKVAEEADKLVAAGKDIAAAGTFVAAGPANSTVDEGEITMAAVQQHIDANPDGLRQFGAGLADNASRIATAARAKDAKTAGDLISGMDQVCESCHTEFWYPEQKALIEGAAS